MDIENCIRETERAYLEVGQPIPDLSYITPEAIELVEQLPNSPEHEAIQGEVAVGLLGSTIQVQYFWIRAHTLLFTGGPGTVATYKEVTGSNTCTGVVKKDFYYNRKFSGSYCGNGQPIWQVQLQRKIRVPNV